MKTLLVAVRKGESLFPLTDRSCPALLPIGGRALLVHSLEALASSGLRHVGLIVGDCRREIEELVGDGRRWGLAIEYLSCNRMRDIEDIIQQKSRLLAEDVLVMQGDLLRSVFISRFLAEARSSESPICAATIGGKSAGIWLIRQNSPPSWWRVETDGGLQFEEETWHPLEISGAAFNRLDSLAAYHAANLDVATGRYEGLRVPGRRIAEGVVVGDGSQLPLSAVRGRSLVLAQKCAVDPKAELKDNVVLSDGVIVGAHATLHSSVVLPHTYIGDWINLTQAIVRGQDLIRVDAGATVRVTDTFLLRDLAPPRREGRVSSWYQRWRTPVRGVQRESESIRPKNADNPQWV